MTTRDRTLRLLKASAVGLVCFVISGSAAWGQKYAPLTRADFRQIVGPSGSLPAGFGDRQNSWPWSMAWFKGKLYVGTNRSYHCTEVGALHLAFPTIFQYPPDDPDILCPGAPDVAALPLQAEIWSWDPATDTWTRVFQSENDVPLPEAPGKFTTRDTGFRTAMVFREPDGTDALYFSGVSAKWIWAGATPARILRTVDGVNFAPLPQDQGTLLGSLENSSFRGMTALNGRFYIVAGNIIGQGVLLESSDPKLGNDSFRVVTPPDMLAYEVQAFNNQVYVGTLHREGFEVYRTDATGSAPYNWTLVIPHGGYWDAWPPPNQNVISFGVFKDRLYVGGNGVQSWFGAELYRVNPDDTWELVHGRPRLDPGGAVIAPISGLGPGFGWPLNAHMWRQEVFDNRMYVGTFDMATIFKNIPIIAGLVAREMGADMWTSEDGAYWTPIDRQGFQDKFNFGFRTFSTTPYGMFVGTANYYYGFQLWHGIPFGFRPPGGIIPGVAAASKSTSLSPPARLDGEENNGQVLLGWEPSPGALAYAVYRSEYTAPTREQLEAAISLLGDSSTVNLSALQSSEAVMMPGDFQQIGVTDRMQYADKTAKSGGRYLYHVRAYGGEKGLSGPSNYVAIPSQASVVTFADVSAYLRQLSAQKKFTSTSTERYVWLEFNRCFQEAAKGNAEPLATLYRNVRLNRIGSARILQPLAAQDLEVRLGRLLKRVYYHVNRLLATGDL